MITYAIIKRLNIRPKNRRKTVMGLVCVAAIIVGVAKMIQYEKAGGVFSMGLREVEHEV